MSTVISLAGTWDFRFDDEREWRPIAVPGCWEALEGVAKNASGPTWYRKRIDVPPEFNFQRIYLRFDGVGYHCVVSINGREVGGHTGAWDAFEFDVTKHLSPGRSAELLVKVEKPASLSGGPASKPLPGNFPLKQTLSGFLPYVWGHMFGGIWQDVSLRASGPVAIESATVRGDADGRVRATVCVDGTSYVDLEILDAKGNRVAQVRGRGREVSLQVQLDDPLSWSPRSPTLYTARIRAGDSDESMVRFGLRTQSVAPDGHTILLNGEPIYPRMALSWGWYPESLHSNPGPERVRADFERLKSLGYNGVKLCLWFPPQYYFDIADEMGMLLWVELPMWLPEPSEFFREQTPIEYERLMKLASAHPSVILYTLGCELNAKITADILHPLFKLVKSHAHDALVRDNSGGGDAYGGLMNEFAEFYDYHFYSDLQFFRPLLDSFSPRWRPAQPWVFGEFCDLDTFRDLRHLYIANGDKRPWWTVRDETINPQGARWQFDIVDWETRLKANGYWERGEELERVSREQALLHRKVTLETVRLYREIGGYVVTGETDTPISTAGMWDDLGRVKFEKAGEFRAFNDDLVVLVGWDRRRAWINGGDRAAPFDTWGYRSGTTIRAHLVASHYGRTKGKCSVRWMVRASGGEIADAPYASGEATTAFALEQGALRELATAEFVAPKVDRPQVLTLQAAIRVGDEEAANTWPIYVFPSAAWDNAEGIVLFDPPGRLHDLPGLAKGMQVSESFERASVVLATEWTDKLSRFVSAGGRAIVLQSSGGAEGPITVTEMPFWREAVRLIETDHPAWGDFPLDGGIAGYQFFGCATDRALDTAKLSRPRKPILRRLDARTVAVHDYATEVEWDKGRMIVSTLRFEGSSGLANSTQPLGITRNISASYLLRCWVRHLASA